MTAEQVIEEIKSLPKEERERVFAFVRESDGTSDRAAQVRYADDQQFEAAMNKVFDTHAGLLKRLAQ
jgi:hypothetical protein